MREVFADPNLAFGEITLAQAEFADCWNKTLNTAKGIPWSWVDIYNVYHSPDGAKRFDLAISAKGALYALCYGIPTKKKMFLKLHFFQGDFNGVENPLRGKVLNAISVAASTYTSFLGGKEIWICNPLNEKLVRYYETHGFHAQRTREQKVTHLTKGV
jgi:hypothetical protein